MLDEVKARRCAKKECGKHSLSVSSVSKASGVSRATFYNKSLLKRYVNTRKQEEMLRTRESHDVSLERRMEEAKMEIALMEEEGALMVQLQIESDRLRRRVRMLEAQLQGGQPVMDGRGELLPFSTKRAWRGRRSRLVVASPSVFGDIAGRRACS